MKFYGIKAALPARMQSTSGGAFQMIARRFLCEGGTVFGAGYDDNLSVRYRKVTSPDGLPIILGSKYAEASLDGSFEEAVRCLSGGKKVLFIGSPCTVNALKSFVASRDSRLADRLFLIDFICSGVPERGFWEAYLKHLETNLKQIHGSDSLQLKSFTFRDKAKADSAHTVSWEYEFKSVDGGLCHKRDECSFLEDRYCRIFTKAISLQQKCFSCKWCSLQRPSDLTIGDYWGVDKYHPSFDDGYGVSLCISNTVRGDSLLEGIIGDVDSIELKEDEIMQPRLSSPQKFSVLNALFRKDLLANGKAEDCDIEMMLKKYGA